MEHPEKMKLMCLAASDPLFLEDLAEIKKDFQHVDAEDSDELDAENLPGDSLGASRRVE